MENKGRISKMKFIIVGGMAGGVFVGIRMLFSGLTLIMLVSAARGVVKEVKSAA